MIYEKKKEQYIYYSLLLLIIIAYIAGLFVDVTRDAAKYAYIAKEMVRSGDWFNLQIHGEYYTQKPQFLFWLSALSYKYLGVSNFSFKLPILIWSFAGIYFAFRLGTALYNRKVGQLAGIMLLFSMISVLYNMDIHTDIVLQTNIVLALWMLYLYLSQRKWLHLLGAGCALGLIVLTKGPFGLAVPFFAVTGYLISTRQMKRFFDWKWAIMFLFAFLVSAPSWMFYFKNWGWEGIKFFVWTNNIGRIDGSYSTGQTPDLLFFVHNLLYLFIPWSLIFFISAFYNFRDLFKKKLSPSDHYVFWGTWVMFLILSLSRGKLPNYILCILPLIAIQTARSWALFSEKESVHFRTFQIFQNVVIYIIWLTILIVPVFIFKMKYPWIIPILMGVLLLVNRLTQTSEPGTRLLLRSIAGFTIGALLFCLSTSPILFSQQAQIKAAAVLNQSVQPGDKVFHFLPKNINDREKKRLTDSGKRKHPAVFKDENHYYLNYELLFYSKYPVQDVISFSQFDSVLKEKSIWIYTDPEGRKMIEATGGEIDTCFTFSHFNLAKTIRYINPSTRSKAMGTRHLLLIKDHTL